MRAHSGFVQFILGAALGAAAGMAAAQTAPDSDAYAIDNRGAVVRSGHGLCWQTSRWTPAMAIAECDPDLVAKPVAQPAPAPVVRAAEPAPMPKSAPVAAAKAPAACNLKEALQSDATFVFGKAGLTAAATKQLDAMAARLAGCSSINHLSVTGHTDRISGARMNAELSEQRAKAVSDYLTGKGVKAESLVVVGAGPNEPVAGVECAGKMARKQLIACLAPNRRVAVEAQGVTW